MSRLTSSPFHKPSPFQFPHALPSPPETQAESINMTSVIPPSVAAGIHDHGINEFAAGLSSPDQGSRIRRTSSLAYNPSGLREAKDSRPVQRPTKPLIIVIPPSGLIPGYAQASNALSMGPSSRMLQGTIMPLLPSMFAQLTAIAKEFNFPSVVGLSLYMHYVEDGIAITPRIAEDSWQSIWTHFSEPSLLPHERKALIAGKIEFDVDLRHARWYTTWISNILREVPDALPTHYPTAAPSIAHFRGDSKTTFTDGRVLDDDIPETQSPRILHTSIARHAPRKLSLVERFDVSSARPDNKPLAPPAELPNSAQVLSPIVQEDEPQSARNDLDNRVKSWRASALISAHKLSAKGQPSLDPPNLPNDIPIQSPSLPMEEEVELNLADYTWSVSSMGPASYGELSPISWSRVSSVDLAHRAVGSVCSTPSICTSFGPADYESLSSPVSWARVPSVHLGDRLAGSVATTLSVCTSFGPADYDPLSPLALSSRIPSPDIAHRFFESAPPTPLTATSWGAPSSYPPSPACYSATSSVGLGDRVAVDGHVLQRYPRDEEEEEGEIKLFNPWPSTDRFAQQSNQTGEGYSAMPYSEEPTSVAEHRPTVWRHAWPYTSVRSPSPVQEEDIISVKEASSVASKEVEGPVQPWGHAWPYNITVKPGLDRSFTLPSPQARPWGHAWPYNKPTKSSTLPPVPCQGTRPWGHAWPYNSLTSKTDAVRSASEFDYPYMRIYAPAYPNLEIYPPQVKSAKGTSQGRHTLSTHLPANYPCLEIYKPGYPYNLDSIYPAMSFRDKSTKGSQQGRYTLSAHLPPNYPCLEIYKPGYPYNLESIYPAMSMRDKPEESASLEYPYFNLYPAKSGPRYAHLSSVIRTPMAPYPSMEIYPARHENKDARMTCASLSVRAPTHYPVFNLYPPVYPHFDLYPAAISAYERDASKVTTEKPVIKRTRLHIYPPVHPAVYPEFDLYPCMMVPFWHAEKTQTSVSEPARHVYPYFDLYPAVYPHFNLYPAAGAGIVSSTSLDDHTSVRPRTTQAVYPYFDLYPAVYPHFNLYPSVSTARPSHPVERQTKSLSAYPEASYPFFNLYPAIYPHVVPYLSLSAPCLPPAKPIPVPKKHSGVCKSGSAGRLTHSELHAMVMMERASSSPGGFHGSQLSFDEGRTSPISPHLSRSPSGLRPSRITHFAGSSLDLRRPSTNFGGNSSGSVYDFVPRSPDQSIMPLRKSLSLKHREAPTRVPDLPPLRPTAQRRDSLVSQRIKAYAANVDSAHLKETVSKFPMPPGPPPRGLPPVPRIPSDRF